MEKPIAIPEISRDVVVVRGGYKKAHPPEDDCCPICLDSFKFPCRTNCGHWYCGSCFLQLWRHSDDMERCKCPMCGSVVKKLIPCSSELIPPGEDGRQILKDLRAYNYQRIRRWFAFFLEMVMMLRSLPPEGHKDRRRALFLRTYGEITIIVVMAIHLSFFGLIPSWLGKIMVTPSKWFHVIFAPFLIFLECGDWRRRRAMRARDRARRRAKRARRIARRAMRLAQARQLE